MSVPKARISRALIAFLSCILASPVLAGEDPLVRRMDELRALFREEPGGFEKLFHSSFLKAVPAARVKIICKNLFEKHGACSRALLSERKGRWSGVFELVFEKNVTMPSTLSIENRAPHQIIGWWIGLPQPATSTLAGMVENLKKLPGRISFAVARLGKGEPEILASLNPDMPLAIGSTFKLYILGGAAKAVGKGRLQWKDVVPLREAFRSFPSGQLQEWPVGAPVTVHTLASLMISISDNTATDHLLFTVGRRAVEEMLPVMGNRHAEKSIPFLSTLEMFKLKCAKDGAPARKYLGMTPEEKRRFLDGEIKNLGRESVPIGALTRPTHIDTLEWFASASDLVRAINWLRRASEKPGLEPVRRILSINKGIQISSRDWPYAGFKGGSEPGVLNGTFLLKSASGCWFALSAGWNNKKEDVDTARFFGLIQKTVRILAKRGLD